MENYLEVSAGLGSKDVREVLYMEESCPSLGMVQSGTRAHETDLTQDTLARSKAPLDGSCVVSIDITITASVR